MKSNPRSLQLEKAHTATKTQWNLKKLKKSCAWTCVSSQVSHHFYTPDLTVIHMFPVEKRVLNSMYAHWNRIRAGKQNWSLKPSTSQWKPQENPGLPDPSAKLFVQLQWTSRLVHRAQSATCWAEGHQSILGSPSTWGWACSGETSLMSLVVPFLQLQIRTLTSLLQAYCLSDHWGQQDRLHNCRFPSKMKMCRPLLTKQE